MNHTSKILLLIVATAVVLSNIATPAFAWKTGVTIDILQNTLNISNCSAEVIGTVCTDGTVYAGLSGVSTPMYATRCDAGQTWNGTECIGTRNSLAWNNGNATGYVITGTTGGTNGKVETATIVATDSDSDVTGVQPHIAAQYCVNLSENGHSDWYLPSKSELNTLYIHKAAIGNFDSSGTFYRSSTEYISKYSWIDQFIGYENPYTYCNSWVEKFNDGHQSAYGKNILYVVRCVRR